MKKVALIVSIVILTAGLAVAGYFGYQLYQLKNDPLVKILSHVDELKTSQSTTIINVKDSGEIFEPTLKDLPLGDVPVDVVAQILANILSKVDTVVEQKLVLDYARDDFGVDANINYKYKDDKLISLDVATDFNMITLGSPELLSKNFKLEFKDYMGKNLDKPIDFKAYAEILAKDEFPSDRKKIYFKIVREFLNDERIKKVQDDNSNTLILADGKSVEVDIYNISLTYTEKQELIRNILDVLKDDEVTKNYIMKKYDALYKQYIDSGDYKITGLDKEAVEDNYQSVRKDFLDRLDKGDFDILDRYFKLNLEASGLDPKSSDTMNFSYTIYLDKENYIRGINYKNEYKYGESSFDIVFNAIGDDVPVEPVLDLSNTYDKKLDLKFASMDTLSKYGDELIDNFTDNILGSPAVESVIADSVKELKASRDFKGKEETIKQVKDIKETVEGIIALYKAFNM